MANHPRNNVIFKELCIISIIEKKNASIKSRIRYLELRLTGPLSFAEEHHFFSLLDIFDMLLTASIRKDLCRNNLVLKVCQQRLNHTIASDDLIHRVDLRVGKIVQIEQHPDATHLFIEQGE